MLKKHWFLSNNDFVEVFSSSAIAVLAIIAVSHESWYHMLRCYHTSSWQSDAHDAIAHAATTLQAIRAVTMVDGLPRAASLVTWRQKNRSCEKSNHSFGTTISKRIVRINTYPEMYLLCLSMRFRESLGWYKFAGMMPKSQKCGAKHPSAD